MEGFEKKQAYVAAVVLSAIFFIMYLFAFLNSGATSLNVVFLGVVIVLAIGGLAMVIFRVTSVRAVCLMLQLCIFFYFSMWAALASDSHDGEETTLFAFGAILGLLFIFAFSYIIIAKEPDFASTTIVGAAPSAVPRPRKNDNSNKIKSSNMLTSPGDGEKDEDMASF